MKGLFIFVRFIVAALLFSLYCRAASAQASLSGNQEASQSGLTGAGVGSNSLTAAKAGGADGLGNPTLGGERHPIYRLRPSDVVEVSFTVAPEFNQTLTVQPDGYVMLKDAGPIEAQGRNLEEFSLAVQKAYRGYLHDPQVAVALKEFEHPYFIVGGELGHPGKYELRTDTSILEAVQIAGGFTHEAKHSQVVLFRHVNDNLVEAHVFDIKKMLKEKSLSEVPRLRPGDMVFVPQNTISKMERFLSKPDLSMYVSTTQF